jgi:hypothetical protein
VSGKVIDIPGNPVTFAPETLPWATQGTTLPPNSSQQETGWQPYGVGPPPDYRLENYARLTQSVLNARANQAGLYLEYSAAVVEITGVTVGNNRRITVDGTNIDYADQAGDTLADVVAAFITLINTDPAASLVAVASTDSPGIINIIGLEAGNNYAVTVSVIAGAGTIAVLSSTTACVTRQPGDLAYGADLVIGSPNLDDDAVVGHQARIIWDKSKAAFAAGKATGTQFDDVNRGIGSVNLGIDNTASGSSAVALGSGSLASGNNSVAIGYATATQTGAVALGGAVSSASATGQSAIAAGTGASASASNAIAIGTLTSASNSAAVAIGSSSTASAVGAVALTGTASAAGAIAVKGTASAAHSIAIGENVLANTAQASIAIGYGTGAGLLSATGLGAIATGQGDLSNAVTAIGRGARAHGAPNGAINGAVTASGIGAEATGELVTASGDYSDASGIGAIATNRGESAKSALCDITLPKQDLGKHQVGQVILQARTTDATATRLCTDSLVGTGSNWTPKDYRAYAVSVKVVAKDGAGKYGTWFGQGMIDKDAGAITIYNSGGMFGPGGVTPTYHTGVGMNAATVAITASGGGVAVTVSGIGATVIRWTASIEYAQAGEDP